ncbi:MAG: DUF2378 family protein [Myxococcaceae bacterium]
MGATPVHPELQSMPASMPLAQRVNFKSVFEGLFTTAYADQLTPELKAKLKDLGVDLDALQPAYPHQVFLAAVSAAAAAWYPTEPADQAWFKIGVRNLEGFYATFLGRPLFALLKVLGPRRTAARMSRNFRSANNYSESKLVEVGPSELQLWLNDVGDTRHFIRGVMFRGLQLAGAPQVRVEELATDANGTVFGVRL